MKNSFKISLPSSDGYYGRKCNNLNCNKYFKVHEDFLEKKMFCPYCGDLFEKDDLNTSDQLNYATNTATEKVTKDIFDAFDKSLRNVDLKIKYKPKIIPLNFDKEILHSELICPKCNFKFQVYGIFGYCPGCRVENILIYDANFQSIKEGIVSSNNKNRDLRHAYADIVTTFENFCKKIAKEITSETTNFQNLNKTREFFIKFKEIDINANLTKTEYLIIRRIFQKRHSFHSDGIVDQKYITNIPEDQNLHGKKVDLSLEEFEKGALVLRKIINNLI